MTISRSDRRIRLIDSATLESLQVLENGDIIHVELTESDVVCYCTISNDKRLAIQIGHVIRSSDARSLAAALQSICTGERRRSRASEASMIATEQSPDVQMYLAYYLGFVGVPRLTGSKVVQQAIRANSEIRRGLEDLRIAKRLAKSARLNGMSKTDERGTHVQEYLTALVVTPRSLRIIDLVAGETISKFFVKQVTFQGVQTYKAKPDVYAMIINNPNQKGYCHMFYVNTGVGTSITTAMTGTLKEATAAFDKVAKKADKNVFTALDGYEREAAPAEFFDKQIRRKHLIPDRVLGAGEFGEVWLATQTHILEKRGSTKMLTRPRAVKMLKAGASKAAKEEYLHECRMLLKCGAGVSRSESMKRPGARNLVRMVGVALQQAPWLCVLEYMPYGDLRNFLKMTKSKNIVLEDAEILSWHMDLAARNVLVGESNIVKIADFGMSEEMDPGVETKTFKEPIRCAIKWTAMESMIENQFSAASDCWSLGIVLWEICTYGGTPYAHVSNMDMLYFLIGGDRLMQPLDCPQSLWEVMERCWMENPAERWRFAAMEERLQEILEETEPAPPRDVGKYVHNSKGEKTKALKAAQLPGEGDKKGKKKKVTTETGDNIYVYDVPIPKEVHNRKKEQREALAKEAASEPDAYDVPLNQDAATKTSAPAVTAEEAEAAAGGDAYDIPIGTPAPPAKAAAVVPTPDEPDTAQGTTPDTGDKSAAASDGDDGDDGDDVGAESDATPNGVASTLAGTDAAEEATPADDTTDGTTDGTAGDSSEAPDAIPTEPAVAPAPVADDPPVKYENAKVMVAMAAAAEALAAAMADRKAAAAALGGRVAVDEGGRSEGGVVDEHTGVGAGAIGAAEGGSVVRRATDIDAPFEPDDDVFDVEVYDMVKAGVLLQQQNDAAMAAIRDEDADAARPPVIDDLEGIDGFGGDFPDDDNSGFSGGGFDDDTGGGGDETPGFKDVIAKDVGATGDVDGSVIGDAGDTGFDDAPVDDTVGMGFDAPFDNMQGMGFDAPGPAPSVSQSIKLSKSGKSKKSKKNRAQSTKVAAPPAHDTEELRTNFLDGLARKHTLTARPGITPVAVPDDGVDDDAMV